MEIFSPNEYLMSCTMTASHNYGNSFKVPEDKVYKGVFHDTSNLGYYDDGEKEVNNYTTNLTIDINTNVTAGFIYKQDNGSYKMQDIYGSTYGYYREYDNDNWRHPYKVNTIHLYALIGTDHKTYYFTGRLSFSNNNAS